MALPDTIAERARSSRRNLAAARQGVACKLAVLRKGESPVSETCQIPDVRAIYAALGFDPRRGTFVEIGGYDGQSFSNTSFLADQGWRGVYVEPISRHCAQIRARHVLNKVAIEPVAIAAAPGTTTIHLMGALTSTSDETRAAYGGIEWATGDAAGAVAIEVRTDTLAAVLSRHKVPNRLELMVIDVEGAEEPIVMALLAGVWRPQVLIVELNDLHPDFAPFPQLQDAARRCRHALISAGYEEFYSDAINTVFAWGEMGVRPSGSDTRHCPRPPSRCQTLLACLPPAGRV